MSSQVSRTAGPILLALVLTAAGCTRHARPADPGLARSADASWSLVLEQFVDEDGLVDFDALAEDRRDLDNVVRAIAADDASRDGDDELAWLVNAYNALAMHNVLESGKPPSDLPGFFVFQQYEVGGRYINLYDLERKVLLPLGEERVHFAINCMSMSCPRLERTPFDAATLEERLDAATRAFANDSRHVRVDDDAETVHLSKILDWYRKDFTRDGTTVVEYLNRYREESIPPPYRVRYMDYDWTLIAQPPASSDTKRP